MVTFFDAPMGEMLIITPQDQIETLTDHIAQLHEAIRPIADVYDAFVQASLEQHLSKQHVQQPVGNGLSLVKTPKAKKPEMVSVDITLLKTLLQAWKITMPRERITNAIYTDEVSLENLKLLRDTLNTIIDNEEG